MSSHSVEGDSMNTSVADLAAEAKKDEAKRLGAIISINSNNNIQDLSAIITGQAVDGIYNQVQDVLDQPRRLLQIVNTNEQIQNILINNVYNLRNETSGFLLLKSFVDTSPYINGITCLTYPNIRGGDTTTQYPNITEMSIYQQPGMTNTFIMDWSTGPYLYVGFYYPDGKVFVNYRQAYDFNFAYALTVQPGKLPPFTYSHDFKNTELMIKSPPTTTKVFINMVYHPENLNVSVDFSSTHGDLISAVSQSVYVPSISTKHPAYACGVGFQHKVSLDPLFSNIKVTGNTHVFLMDIKTNGTLMANSVPNSLFYISNYSDPQLPMVQYTADSTNDSDIRVIGGFLKGMYGSYGSRYLQNPNHWLLVVAIPRADFFAKTDEANKRAAIIAACIGVAGLGFAGLASWIAMRPLQTLTSAMEKLTKLDFSALEGDILNDRSFMTEVRKLQSTFALMCKAFASGIKRNKNLVGGRAAGTGGGSSTQQMGSHNSLNGVGKS
ncbi:hypothetical protein HDU76_010983 [Blyttiomyces sp. JEL0837]|nr:hypothetical protein HDU76_010983 [Blyttiomyces sp. JEL0837]